MTLSPQARRDIVRQLDRDVDSKFGLDRMPSPDLDPKYEPSPFWVAMEGHTHCPVCGDELSANRDCRHGCLDDLHDRLLGLDRTELRPDSSRDRRGWLRR